MHLNNKYELKELPDQFVLRSTEQVEIVDPDGNPTGEFKIKEGKPHYYMISNKGREQVYQRILNLEISKEEDATLTRILEIVSETSNQIMEFLSEADKVEK